VGVRELPRQVDTSGNAAKRDETPGRTGCFERSGREDRRRNSEEEKRTRENEPVSQETGDGRFEEAWPWFRNGLGHAPRVTR